MRIGVIGSVALGLFYGALLQRAGHNVHFLRRRDYQAITSSGLKVTSPRGDFPLTHVKGPRKTTELGQVAQVLIRYNAYADPSPLAPATPFVSEDTVYVTRQNGFGNVELLSPAFAAEQLMGGVACLCCHRGQ